jgi:hypothetical protein
MKELQASGKRKPWKDGDVVEAKDGTRYVLTNTLRDGHGRKVAKRDEFGATFVREYPKVRGKAARRADKKRRGKAS